MLAISDRQATGDVDVPLMTDLYPDDHPASRVFPTKSIFRQSVALAVSGCCSIVANSIGLADTYSLLVSSPGFYCGIFFVATGGIGMETARQKSKCLIITLMVMSTIASGIFMMLLFGLALASLVKDTNKCMGSDKSTHDCYFRHLLVMATVMEGLLVTCSIVAGSLSTSISVICYRFYCSAYTCNCSCTERQDVSVPAYQRLAATSQITHHVSSPNPIPNSNPTPNPTSNPNPNPNPPVMVARETKDNMRYLAHVPPAHLQYLAAMSLTNPWHSPVPSAPAPPSSPPHHHPTATASAPPPQASAPPQDKGQDYLEFDPLVW